MTSSSTIPLAILFGGIVIAGAVYLSIPKKSFVADLSLARPVSVTDHILGNPVAKVVVVTYTDFDCAFCKNFHIAMNQIIAQAGTTGEVAWVVRQFPLVEIHQNALSHARALECVAQTGGNDLFWKFADALFSAQPALPQAYSAVANSVGIQGGALASCIASPSSELDERIQADRENALALGANGTPYSVIFLDGTPVDTMEGGYSYSAIEAKIREILK